MLVQPVRILTHNVCILSSKDFLPMWGWRFEFSFPCPSVRVFSLTVGSHAVGLSPYSGLLVLFFFISIKYYMCVCMHTYGPPKKTSVVLVTVCDLTHNVVGPQNLHSQPRVALDCQQRSRNGLCSKPPDICVRWENPSLRKSKRE